MHGHDPSLEELTEAIVRYAVERIALDPPPLDGRRTPGELREAVDRTITADGIGGLRALELFTDELALGCISTDHPRYLAFVPASPTKASVLFDLIVGASSIYAGSWLEGGGAIAAENAALRWIADLAGLPATAGGVFVSGGTAGNLSALMAARWSWRHRSDGRNDTTRGLVLTSSGAHSSIGQAGMAMDVDVVRVAADDRGHLPAELLATAIGGLSADDRDRLFAVAATAGTTNAGVIDDLEGIADVCVTAGIWFHVDAAYGGAALAAPSARPAFAGIERADSLIVDPHKWLFAPFDSCALIYRDPRIARSAHTQNAAYLDALHDDDDWNASDYAHHLSRRARGLPLWFSLATYGTDAYAEAIEHTLATARAATALIRADPVCELVLEPELSVVVFRRLGWEERDYKEWSAAQLASGHAFVVPTKWRGETVLRLCIVNPRTTEDDIASILGSLHP